MNFFKKQGLDNEELGSIARKLKYKKLEPGNVDIARLEGGGSCGELCLIDGKPRMATVKTLKRTHFLILNKKLYNEAL